MIKEINIFIISKFLEDFVLNRSKMNNVFTLKIFVVRMFVLGVIVL